MKETAARVAIFFSSLRGAGIQRVMLNLAEGLLGHGLEVDLVVLDAGGELLPTVPPGARLVDLQVPRSAYALPGLIRYLRRERPAAVLSSQVHMNLVAIWARALSRVPARLVVSEHIDLAASGRNASHWKDRLLPAAAGVFYRRADGVVVVSRGAAERLSLVTGLPEERVRVIYNPVITPDLLIRAQQPPDHPWFGPGRPAVILSAGRLTRQKDQAALVQAFALLRRSQPARLVILGEGEERRALEALVRKLDIQEDVSLPGFASNPFALMAHARVFVLSSQWEGFGNVLVEAMACGTPVVSTDCPSGPAEILENGRYGALTPPGDPEALAAAIRKSLEHPVPAGELKARAMQFSLERILPQYLDVLLPS